MPEAVLEQNEITTSVPRHLEACHIYNGHIITRNLSQYGLYLKSSMDNLNSWGDPPTLETLLSKVSKAYR